eukprot:6193610-Pleurochrysis_carterae.AAC.1
MMASLLAIFFCGLFSCVYSIHFPPTRSLAIRMSADPFRPSRPPLAPILINAIQDLLMLEQPTIDDARGVVRKTIVSRNVDPDYNMTAAEEKYAAFHACVMEPACRLKDMHSTTAMLQA